MKTTNQRGTVSSDDEGRKKNTHPGYPRGTAKTASGGRRDGLGGGGKSTKGQAGNIIKASEVARYSRKNNVMRKSADLIDHIPCPSPQSEKEHNGRPGEKISLLDGGEFAGGGMWRLKQPQIEKEGWWGVCSSCSDNDL